MRIWVRRGLIAVAALIGLLVVAVVVGLQLGERRAGRRIEVAVQAVPVPADAAALARGRYLFESRGCAECHGGNGAGRVFAQDGESLKLAAPNISRGSGSVTLAYRPVDWVRTIRHGVKPDGRPVRVMPSEDYNRLTDADLGALLAHIAALPPAPGGPALLQLPLPARVLYGFGQIPEAAEKIDHRLPPQQAAAEGITVEHGRYVANMCLGCHGLGLEGGKIAGGPPDWPPAARLAPGQGSAIVAHYRDADAFVRMLRSGSSPDGRKLAVMPFETLARLNDTDARALHLYLTSLPVR